MAILAENAYPVVRLVDRFLLRSIKLRHERGCLCPGHDSPKIELAGLAKEETGKKGEDGGKMPEQGLAKGVEDGLLEKAGPAEAGRK